MSEDSPGQRRLVERGPERTCGVRGLARAVMVRRAGTGADLRCQRTRQCQQQPNSKPNPKQSMAYTQLNYHITFRPHCSVPAITEVHERDLYAFVNGFCNHHNCKLIRINSMPDHIHILVSLPPTMAVASFVHDLKLAAGKFLRAHPDKFPLFTTWARSYYAGTCGPMDKERVRRYIMRQKEHHKKKSYRQEIIRQLKKAGIEYDEQYLLRD